jgi:hypothetical protein
LPVTIGFFPLIPAAAREFIGLTRRCQVPTPRDVLTARTRGEVAVVVWNGQHQPVSS